MNEHSPGKAIDDVSVPLHLFKFYEQTAGATKGRTWTIAAWILTVNSGLIGFSLSSGTTTGPNLVQLAACAAGVALSAFLVMVLLDQGGHLQLYWKYQDQAAQNPLLADFRGPNMSREPFMSKVVCVFPSQFNRRFYTQRPFPKFCGNLMLLALFYLAAFLASSVYLFREVGYFAMWILLGFYIVVFLMFVALVGKAWPRDELNSGQCAPQIPDSPVNRR